MNTDQKLPAESAGERPSTPLFGHAISHAATLIGLFAIVLWGFMAGLVRLVSESFGATLGSALIYTVGGMLLLIVRRPKPISQAPRKYLVAGGLMFSSHTRRRSRCRSVWPQRTRNLWKSASSIICGRRCWY